MGSRTGKSTTTPGPSGENAYGQGTSQTSLTRSFVRRGLRLNPLVKVQCHHGKEEGALQIDLLEAYRTLGWYSRRNPSRTQFMAVCLNKMPIGPHPHIGRRGAHIGPSGGVRTLGAKKICEPDTYWFWLHTSGGSPRCYCCSIIVSTG